MNLLSELKRRNVFRVAIAYLVFGWLVLQVADVLFPALHLPVWSITLVAVLLAIGFVPAMIFAWAYELTPEGLKRESEVDRSKSVTHQTARRLDLITIGMLVLAGVALLADRLLLDRESSGLPAQSGRAGDTTPIVAVLPFKATGSDDGGFLASGLHDDLLTRLARLEAFTVISRTSMMEYADTTKNMREIGEELGAEYILEGGVQARGDRVRINAQLIDATADRHLWADNYDRELTAANLFDIQAELAAAIADQLETELSASDRALINDVPTESSDAYNSYLRGLDLFDTGGFNVSNARAVVGAFEDAVELDPQFGLAWALLSRARTRLAALTDDRDVTTAAVAAYTKAQVLAPDLRETRLAWVAFLYRSLFEYAIALDAIELLAEQGPLDAASLRLKSYLMKRLGRPVDAYRAMIEAQRLEPRSIQVAYNLIELSVLSDDCESAARHVRNALELSPDSAEVRAQAARYELECTGDASRALAFFDGIDFAVEAAWVLWSARWAATIARDSERTLALGRIARTSPDAYVSIADQLWTASALRSLDREEEAARVLEAVEAELSAFSEQDVRTDSTDYAGARKWYHSLMGDPEATQYWVEEHKRRFHEETKGDRIQESYNQLGYASDLAVAGVRRGAIEELAAMLEAPGGFGFRFVDAWPDFDVLKDDAAYVALRERFDDIR